MASTDDALETYSHIPLEIDPQTKQVSALSSDRNLQSVIASLNALHTSLKGVETANNIPPPPGPVNPKRTAQISKLRDSANIASRKAQWPEAIRLWTFVVDMAAGRPSWEPTGLVREELAASYLARANCHAAAQNWVEAWKDAECSTECKRGPAQGPNGERIPGNPRAFILGGRCLTEMGRWTEAVEWLERAIEIEGKDGEEGKELTRMLAQARKEADKGQINDQLGQANTVKLDARPASPEAFVIAGGIQPEHTDSEMQPALESRLDLHLRQVLIKDLPDKISVESENKFAAASPTWCVQYTSFPLPPNATPLMLSAFTARPIVELKQRDKSKIESILSHSDQLLVGLSTGSLRIYRVNNDNDPSVELLREYEKFSKYRIEQLAIFKEANILVSLSNALVSIHDLGTYELQEQLTKTKGATLFAATSNIVSDSSGVPTLVSKLAVAVKRRLLLWSWHDGELAGEPVETALPNSLKSLTWASGTKIVVGLNSNYVLLNVDTQDVKTIVGPGSIGGAPGQDSGRLGTGTMSYIGMGGMIPTPLATGLGEKEMLLAKDINTHFIDREGEPIGRRQIPWRGAPEAVGYSYPYLLALEEAAKGVLEVRNPQTLTLLQSIDLPGATKLQVPNPNISLAHQGKGFLVASDRVIWRMNGLSYDAQIDVLVDAGSYDEAISLIEMIEETLIKGKDGRLREIKMQKAQKLFDEKKFRDSLDLFAEVSAPPERVIKLYPAIIAGETPGTETIDAPDQLSPSEKSPGKGHKTQKSITSIRSVQNKSSLASLKKEQDLKSDTASIKSSPDHLSEKELKLAVGELRGFLADIRRRLPRFFDTDQSVRDLTALELNNEENRKLLLNLLDLQTLDDDDISDKLTNLARLVDTTLFRAHMYASPSLVGSLFRIANFCDPDVVMVRLEETGRYTELIDFLYGKRLHRQALERLQKFGQAEETDENAQLRGTGKSIAYLQNLPPELIHLILEFARWPMETDPNMAMEIFMADTENAELLPRPQVLAFLESIDKYFALRYLEHVIDELHDSTPELHQKLLTLYLERLKDPTSSNNPEVLDKFLTLLRTSTQYSPAKVLGLLPTEDPIFYEPRAIVFSKMEQHKQALEIYVFKLHDPAKAEEYCNQTHLDQQMKESNTTIARRGSTTDPVDEQPSIYHTLLNLYLNPPKTEKPMWGPAIEIMARHGARLPANSTLEMIPQDLLVKELEFYFRGRIRNANSIMNDSKVVVGLRKVEAVRLQAALLLGDGVDVGDGRMRKVRVDEDRVCGVCHKRLGGSVISVFPDNSVVHLGCASRRQT